MAEFHSGKDGRTTVGTDELAILSWSCAPTVDHAEFRNSKTGKHTVVDPTFMPPCPITIVLDWDFESNPFADSPGLTVGAFVSNTKLFLAGGSAGTPAGDCFTFPSAMVKTTPVETVIDGKIGLSIQLISSGAWTYPGGTDPADNIENYTSDTEGA